ncbi:MAG: ABC transporter permease [Actinomycetota bacterium]|nr:ABC transporter permease [Actinomycetota bacterium]
MKVFIIARNSVRRMLRDRSNLFFVFVLPIVLLLVIGLVFGGGFESRVGLVVLDNGPLAQELAARIDDLETLDVVRVESESAGRSGTRRNDLDAVVVIPNGYSAALLAGENVELDYVSTPNSGGFDVQSILGAVVAEEASVLRAARFAAAQTGADPAAALDTARAVREQSATVAVVREGDTAEAGAGQFDLGASQNLVMFMFITAMASSVALIQSRRLGVSMRMLSTPTSARTIVAGETLGRFLVTMLQGLFIVIAAAILFGVDWGDPVAASLIIVTFALAGTGAGMLLGSTFSNEQQAGGIAIFLALILAALGGAMVPLEIFPPTMLKVAHLTPHAWALDGLSELIRFDGGVADILIEIVVLLGFGAVLIGIAAWRFHRVLVR